jgi:hypothetical protein
VFSISRISASAAGKLHGASRKTDTPSGSVTREPIRAATARCEAVTLVQTGCGDTAPMQIDIDPGLAGDREGIAIAKSLIRIHFALGRTQINMNVPMRRRCSRPPGSREISRSGRPALARITPTFRLSWGNSSSIGYLRKGRRKDGVFPAGKRKTNPSRMKFCDSPCIFVLCTNCRTEYGGTMHKPDEKDSLPTSKAQTLTRREAVIYEATVFYGVIRLIEFNEEKRRLLPINFLYELLDAIDGDDQEEARRHLAEVYLEKIIEEIEAA